MINTYDYWYKTALSRDWPVPTYPPRETDEQQKWIDYWRSK